MTEHQRRRRLQRIARRARFLERAPQLEPDAVEDLARQRELAQGGAIGAQWIAYRGAAEARYGRPFWRGQW